MYRIDLYCTLCMYTTLTKLYTAYGTCTLQDVRASFTARKRATARLRGSQKGISLRGPQAKYRGARKRGSQMRKPCGARKRAPLMPQGLYILYTQHQIKYTCYRNYSQYSTVPVNRNLTLALTK